MWTCMIHTYFAKQFSIQINLLIQSLLIKLFQLFLSLESLYYALMVCCLSPSSGRPKSLVTGSDISTIKRSVTGSECHQYSEMTIINGWPLSSLNGRENVKIWSSSSVMLTFPYEWKILEWDVKPKTNKL